MPEKRASNPPTTAALEGWSGRVFLAIGGALYVGPAADTSVHRHHAIQIAIGIDRPFRIRSEPGLPWRQCDSVVIPSDRDHQLDGSGSQLVIIYLEPEAQGELRIKDGTRDFPGLPLRSRKAILDAVLATPGSDLDAVEAARLYRVVLQELRGPRKTSTKLDGRIREAIEAIRSEPEAFRSVSALARSTGLSPRRFRDLFSHQVGMSCRQYLLWMRLQVAIREAARGASLTDAACAAGFADSAHLTRTFRRMFGIIPSSIHRSITLIH